MGAGAVVLPQPAHQPALFEEEVQVALAWLPDKPGSLARATEALSKAGINIESSYVVRTESDRVLVAFGSAEADKADKALQAIRWDEA